MPKGAIRDLRRAQIVSAARALVAKGGLGALTISALEENLDFTRGVITHHFRSKDEIVEAVLTSAIAEIDAATGAEIRAGTNLAEVIHAILSANVRGFIEHEEAGQILLSFWGRIPADPRATELNAKLYQGYRAYCTKLLTAATASGEIPKGHSPEAVAALLVAIVIGTASQVYFDRGAIDPTATVTAAAHAVMAGLRAPPERPPRKRASPPRRRARRG